MNKTIYQKHLESLAINRRYVRFFIAAVRAVVLTRYLLETKESRAGSYYEEVRNLHREALEALPAVEEETRRFYQESEAVNHVVYTLMDPDRIAALYRNLKTKTRL
jgi:hypothetical protein